jgi:hypothetical protein
VSDFGSRKKLDRRRLGQGWFDAMLNLGFLGFYRVSELSLAPIGLIGQYLAGEMSS